MVVVTHDRGSCYEFYFGISDWQRIETEITNCLNLNIEKYLKRIYVKM